MAVDFFSQDKIRGEALTCISGEIIGFERSLYQIAGFGGLGEWISAGHPAFSGEMERFEFSPNRMWDQGWIFFMGSCQLPSDAGSPSWAMSL